MRLVPLVVASLPSIGSVFAAEIREFDLKTVARLGREMNRVSQRADKGATDAIRKPAQQTAIGALKGRLFKIRYDFLVVDDPHGSGFLVYAMPTKPGEVVLGGNFRVTVSADGGKAGRRCGGPHVVADAEATERIGRGKPVAVTTSQIVGNRPLETCVYTSVYDKVIVSVGMVNDNAKVWFFVNDKIYEMTPELLARSASKIRKK